MDGDHLPLTTIPPPGLIPVGRKHNTLISTAFYSSLSLFQVDVWLLKAPVKFPGVKELRYPRTVAGNY